MLFNNKTKTKLVALLSSITLWIYVTTIVDPSETKTFKDIPVTISNYSTLKEKNLNIFQEEVLTANITVKTNLSKLKKLTKDNIIIHGNISNPAPGKNILTLTSNLSDSIKTEIEPSDIFVTLESNDTILKEISLIANKKYSSELYKIELEKENIEVSGSKTIINKIDKVIATIKGNDEDEDSFEEKLELTAIDINGNKVEGIKLSDKYISATISKLPEKESNDLTFREDKESTLSSTDDTK